MSQKMTMINTLRKSDGTFVDVPLEGKRFQYSEIDKGYPTLKFQLLQGWSILEAIVPIVLYYRPYCIVEIGAGASSLYLARAAEQAGVMFYSCDKSPRKKVEFFPDHKFYQLFSEDFMTGFDDTPAIVLIDADHSYEMAKREFEFFFEKLVPGGIIFLHDTMPPGKAYLEEDSCHDCYKFRQELERRPDEMDCFTWPYTAGFMGLTMVIKKDPDRPYWEK